MKFIHHGLAGSGKGTVDYIALEEMILAYYNAGRREELLAELLRLRAAGMDDGMAGNKILNTIEILQRKTVLESKPVNLRLTLTSRCNLACVMCDCRQNPWNIRTAVAEEIKMLLPFARNVQWSGGEVLLSPHFSELFDRACANPYLRQRFDTNALLLDDRWIERILRANVGLDISIDGISPQTYERIRVGGSFEALLNRLARLREQRARFPSYGSAISLSFIIMRFNLHELEGIVDFARVYGFDNVVLNCLYDCGIPGFDFAAEDAGGDPALLDRVYELLDRLPEAGRAAGVKVLDTWPRPEGGNSGERAADKRNEADLCHLPWQQMCMSARGDVTPYCFCKKQLGSVNDHSLMELWNSAVMQEYRARTLSGDRRPICAPVCLTKQLPNLGICW